MVLANATRPRARVVLPLDRLDGPRVIALLLQAAVIGACAGVSGAVAYMVARTLTNRYLKRRNHRRG